MKFLVYTICCWNSVGTQDIINRECFALLIANAYLTLLLDRHQFIINGNTVSDENKISKLLNHGLEYSPDF